MVTYDPDRGVYFQYKKGRTLEYHLQWFGKGALRSWVQASRMERLISTTQHDMYVPTIHMAYAYITLHVYVQTLHVCVQTLHVYVQTLHVCVQTLHVYVQTLHVCVITTHVSYMFEYYTRHIHTNSVHVCTNAHDRYTHGMYYICTNIIHDTYIGIYKHVKTISCWTTFQGSHKQHTTSPTTQLLQEHNN